MCRAGVPTIVGHHGGFAERVRADREKWANVITSANIRLENKSPDFVELFIDIVVKDIRQLEQMLAGIRASAHVLSAERNERPKDEDR